MYLTKQDTICASCYSMSKAPQASEIFGQVLEFFYFHNFKFFLEIKHESKVKSTIFS